eukprot:scaffold99574_cov18-Tisochrysis_lutea.AAC.2
MPRLSKGERTANAAHRLQGQSCKGRGASSKDASCKDKGATCKGNDAACSSIHAASLINCHSSSGDNSNKNKTAKNKITKQNNLWCRITCCIVCYVPGATKGTAEGIWQGQTCCIRMTYCPVSNAPGPRTCTAKGAGTSTAKGVWVLEGGLQGEELKQR